LLRRPPLPEGEAKKIKLRIASPGRPLLLVEVNPFDTVSKLQELIEAERDDMPKARQRIIFCGRELPISKILASEPNPVANGATIHLALRPESRIDRLSMSGDPDSSGGEENPATDLPMAIEIAAQEIRFVQSSLSKSARCTKAIGVSFIALAALFILRGSTDMSWVLSAAGAGLFGVGTLAFLAGRSKSTCFAAIYYYGLWVYMVVLAITLSIPYVVKNDGAAGNQTQYLSVLVLLVMLPFFLCSPCAYCARIHYFNCTRRDMLLRQFAVIGDEDIPYDALV